MVEYDYTANELKHQDINSLSLKTSIKPINLDFNSLFAKTKSAYVCIYSYEKICTDGWVEGSGGNLVGADNNNEGCFWVLTASYCETVLYADEDYTNYHNNNTATVTISGTTYGGTGGSKTSPMPSPFDGEELMKISVVKSELNLNHLERLWIDKWKNGQYAFQLYDFGVTHLWTDDAKNFAKAAFVALMEGFNDLAFDELVELLEFEQDYRVRMSDSEIELFDTLTRDEQLNYLWSAKQASDKTEELFSTFCEKYNGKGDAFRHAYWNALSTQRLGAGITNLLTTRHEDKPPTYAYNWKENEMDLFNNQVGRNIASDGSTNLVQDIQTALNNGELRYINNQSSDCKATFSSQIIPTNQ